MIWSRVGPSDAASPVDYISLETYIIHYEDNMQTEGKSKKSL